MAGSEFDSFLESLGDETGQSLLENGTGHSLASDEIENESTREMDIWRDFIDPKQLDSLESIFTLTIPSSEDIQKITPVQNISLVCGIPHCSFEDTDWNAMMSHKQQQHSQRLTFSPHRRCTKCNKVFSHKNNLIRHRGRCSCRKSYYCPDCLN